jgi:hypothetical protein
VHHFLDFGAHHLALGRLALHLGGTQRSVERVLLAPDARPAGLAAEQVETGVHHDPMDPGAERGPALEPMEVAPGLQEGVLNGVLGVVGVAQYLGGHHQRARPHLRQQRFEDLAIATPGASDPRIRRVVRLGICLGGSVRVGRRRLQPVAHDRHTGLWRFGRTFGSGDAGFGQGLVHATPSLQLDYQP